MTKLRSLVRCLVTCGLGVLLVLLAVRFGEALWRAVSSVGR
ncbi:hypothetical protein [Saccharothrix violaceirubra]|uniref:Uncharacterized protein n=1 Tax=Saccharothrix violaceirubra TaxID=413306 RepID=A0A7W7WXZ8_9PSEU|nr:hypothetical protein [Saccharothrix violaceirubra]MBB4967969.1 hypothetical protein [Saccharothrix violaceirubra]